jgi:hypothetical protein
MGKIYMKITKERMEQLYCMALRNEIPMPGEYEDPDELSMWTLFRAAFKRESPY